MFVATAALSWGVYVPTVHAAADKLGSNLRAFLMVGVAYFLTAVLVPCLFIFVLNNDPTVRFDETVFFLVFDCDQFTLEAERFVIAHRDFNRWHRRFKNKVATVLRADVGSTWMRFHDLIVCTKRHFKMSIDVDQTDVVIPFDS